MHKLLITLLLFLLGCNTPNKNFIEGKTYYKVHTNVKNIPTVVEFFSFLCPYCYNLEKAIIMKSNIKTPISKSIKVTKYHVDFIGGKLGKLLTKIWVISKILGLENQILIPIFEDIQIKHHITNLSNLKNTFLKLTHLDNADYEFLKNCFVTKSLLYKQKIIENSIHLNYVPAYLIKGKYLINNEELHKLSNLDYIKNYINIIEFLLQIK